MAKTLKLSWVNKGVDELFGMIRILESNCDFSKQVEFVLRIVLFLSASPLLLPARLEEPQRGLDQLAAVHVERPAPVQRLGQRQFPPHKHTHTVSFALPKRTSHWCLDRRFVRRLQLDGLDKW